jgi:REP element-mobilizing transposase RayT
MKKSFTRRTQRTLFKCESSAYGGDLLTKRAARKRGRPLSTRETMHLVLRSTKAKGVWSFRHRKNDQNTRKILKKFAAKYGVQILSLGNAGNHLHLQLKLSSRHTYKAFIRAVTGAIAMAITGKSRWTLKKTLHVKNLELPDQEKFWDRRPFTRIAQSYTAFKNLKNYVRMNHLEGDGFSRKDARNMVDVEQMLMRNFTMETG